MKVIWTMLNQASGKIAGMVAGHLPRGGNVLRSRVIPKNPQSTEQARIRAILASLSAAWSGTLSTVQRDAWNALGGSGPAGTGQNLYVAGNSLLLQASRARVDNAPTGSPTATFTPPAAADVQISIGDSNVLIQGINTGDDWQGASTGAMLVYVSPNPQPKAHTVNSEGLTFVGRINNIGDPVTWGIVPLPRGHTAAAGQVWYVRLVTVTGNGKKSADATYRVLTAATAPRPMQINLDTGDFSFTVFWNRNIDTNHASNPAAFRYWGADTTTRHNANDAFPASPLHFNGTELETESDVGTANTMALIAPNGLTYNSGTAVPAFAAFPVTLI